MLQTMIPPRGNSLNDRAIVTYLELTVKLSSPGGTECGIRYEGACKGGGCASGWCKSGWRAGGWRTGGWWSSAASPQQRGLPWSSVNMAQQRQHRRNYNEPGHAHELTFCCYRGFTFLNAERTCKWLAEAIEAARVDLNFDLWAYVFIQNTCT